VDETETSELNAFLKRYPHVSLLELDWSCDFLPVDEYLNTEALADSTQDVVGILICHEKHEILTFLATAVGRLDLARVKDICPGKFSPDRLDIPYLFLQEFGTRHDKQGQGYGSLILLQLFRNVLAVRKQLGIGIAGIVVHARPEDETVLFYWRKGFRFVEARDYEEFDPKSDDPGFAVRRQDAVDLMISIDDIEATLRRVDSGS
jgi:GNAT superfamily N-acetyltransferase